MRLAVLGSGSSGNSVVIESAGRRLLIDAGFSARQITLRLNQLGEDPEGLDGLLLTHEHQDHTRGAATLLKRHGFPVYATEGTFRGCEFKPELQAVRHTIRSGEPFEVADTFSVEPFSIPHDAREPVGFVVEDREGHRVGLVADLGCRSQLAWGRLQDLDMVLIEANHDLGLLRSGPYPWHLKQRVASRHGHLSNHEAAHGVRELLSDRLQHVVLYHLSRTNNLPALAAQAVGEQLEAAGSAAEIVLTQQGEPTSWLEIHRAA
jgi:phosphoribosyl 1,2-cyclic phosphodiesterase